MNNKPTFIKHCLTIMFFILATQTLCAQHMSMDHQAPSHQKNIFLTMMDTMMIKMGNAPPGESAGANFMLQMIPHHEGAIEMAGYEVRHGKNFTMIQLAKSIVAEQTIEVQQMKLWLKNSLTDTVKATAAFRLQMDKTMTTMMQNMPANNLLTNTDRAFAAVMKPHHQAAVDMAKVVIRFTKDPQINTLAKQIISSQQIEIEQMSSFLK